MDLILKSECLTRHGNQEGNSMCKGTGAPDTKMCIMFWQHRWSVGVKGSGHTALCKALCGRVSEQPHPESLSGQNKHGFEDRRSQLRSRCYHAGSAEGLGMRFSQLSEAFGRWYRQVVSGFVGQGTNLSLENDPADLRRSWPST